MAATLGTISKSYISALDPLLDTREINKKVTDIYNEDELSDVLSFNGNKMPTKQPVYYTFYDDPLIKAVTVTSNTGTGTTQVTPALNAASSGYIRTGDEVMFTNNIVGLVTNVSTSSGIDTVTIKSVAGSNITLGATDTLSIFSRAQGENSYTPSNIRFGISKISNKFQIFRETSRITDIQNAVTVEVDFPGGPKWFFKDQWEKRILMKSQLNAAMWGGDMSVTSYSDTNPILTDPILASDSLSGGGPVQTTRGVNKYIDLYGTALVNGSLGTYLKANLDDLVTNLVAVRAPKEYLVCGSTAAIKTLDDYYKNLGSSGVTAVRLNFDAGGGREIDMEVDKAKAGRFTFYYKVMPILDHPVTFGYSTIPKNLFFLPYNNKVKVMGGGSDDQFRVRYIPRQTPYGDDMINEVHYGALNVINPNGMGMYNGTDFVTYQGLEVLAPQHLLKQRVV